MFRFLHMADLHIDSPLRGLARYENAPAEAIRQATRQAFSNAIDLAAEQGVAFVLIAGDLFDGPWRDLNTGIFFRKEIARLGRYGIRVFAVSGNHDAENKITKALSLPENMTLFPSGKAQTEHLDDFNVAIHGQSFAQKRVVKNLAAAFPPAVAGMFNIGLLHTSLDGREGHATYAPCDIHDLRASDYDYWALGHVHQREIVSQEPWTVFPGCIQGRHARELGPKGVSLVTVEDGEVANVEAHHIDVVRWGKALVDLDKVSTRDAFSARIRAALEEALISADGRLLALRVELVGATALADELSAYPEKVDAEIRSLADELDAEGLWIEKIVLDIRREHALDDALDEGDVLSDLLREILSIDKSPDAIAGARDAIAELRGKLDKDALGDDGLALADEDYLAGLVSRAQKLLVGRLLEGEATR